MLNNTSDSLRSDVVMLINTTKSLPSDILMLKTTTDSMFSDSEILYSGPTENMNLSNKSLSMNSGSKFLENTTDSLPIQNKTLMNVSSSLRDDTVFFETANLTKTVGILNLPKYTNEMSTDISAASPGERIYRGSASTFSWSRPFQIDNSYSTTSVNAITKINERQNNAAEIVIQRLSKNISETTLKILLLSSFLILLLVLLSFCCSCSPPEKLHIPTCCYTANNNQRHPENRQKNVVRQNDDAAVLMNNW